MNYLPPIFKNPQFSIGFINTFLDNLLVSRFRKTPSKGPVAVIWNITHFCNLKCRFCGWWNYDSCFPELIFEEKSVVLDKIADSGVKYLSLCGGEPLICNDLEKVIIRAKSRGLFINISTNGRILKNAARMLIENKVDALTISIDSHLSDIHDNLRGQKGLFHDVLEGVKELDKLRKAQKSSLRIYARCLISKTNAFNMDEYISFWGNTFDGLIFKPIYNNDSCFYKTPE